MDNLIINCLMAMGMAFLATAILGPFLIPILARLKAEQVIRPDGPSRHLGKSGTPTMGGILIISSVILASLTVAGNSKEVALCLAAMVAFGIIGFWDDYIKVVLKRSLGLRAREKLIMQIFFGLIFCVFLVFGLSRGTDVIVPFTGQVLNLAYWYFPFIIFVFMATTNSVNLTDGLDGLAAGSTFIVALGLVLICFITGHYSLAAFSASLAGGCLGFLIYNRHPARIFMGDTGSMALGGAVAAVAALTGTELALVFIGGIYVLEAISDIIQVTSFKMTGRRVFLMAPLHHHFELKGWAEKKVVAFFWFLTLIFVILGIWGLRTPGL